MEASVREALSGVATVQDVIKAFKDEDHCRRLLEAMVWPTGRICLACNYRSSIVLMGRENRKRAWPGLYQCLNGTCRFQFTDTNTFTRDEGPLRMWLSGLWLILQSDNGISSIRLAEALGISQPTAWRMGDALRLMPGREQVLDGVGGNDGLSMRSKPQRVPNYVSLGRRCKGRPKTLKTAALVAVPRPPDQSVGPSAGETRAVMIEDLSEFEADRVLT